MKGEGMKGEGMKGEGMKGEGEGEGDATDSPSFHLFALEEGNVG